MKLTNTQKRMMIIWPLLLIIVAGIFYFIYINGLQQEVSDLEEDVRLNEQMSKALQESVEEMEEEEIAVNDLRARLPRHMDEAQVIRIVNRAATRTNSTIQSYDYQEHEVVTVNELFEEEVEQGTEEIEVLTMLINGQTGSFGQLERFVDEFETHDRLIQINSLQIQTGSEDDISFRMQFSVFAYDE
ncbi:type 4a pilus biogenesis protein PilO [Alkalibacillus aidingensis]|uniref:type 4a pilus biogenesis protein PilO n=1 Tax=Alkalibacillus aidingensis TaxID=2747607 RepID=UPI00166147A0|nr:type 4a pilus biogenesis protein PilO [Alkalibacillus aidingensis]